MTIQWEPLWEIIQTHQRFVLTSHVRPDADALGSELAMGALLEGLGKSVRIVNPSAAPNTLEFLDPDKIVKKLGDGVTAAEVIDTDVHMILDTSAWSQLAEVGDAWKKSQAVKVVIDHHKTADNLGAIEFKDTDCEATGSLVHDFACTFNLPISPQVAAWLFCAIATDTGWFRFSSVKSNTMRRIADLMDRGAQPSVLYAQLFEQKSLARIKLAGRALSRIEQDADGKLAYITVRWEDFEETGASPVDTEDLVNECLKIAGTECSFIAVEQQNRRVKFSLRSKSVNVAAVAEQFQGGGHVQAAGATLSGPLNKAVKQMKEAMLRALS